MKKWLLVLGAAIGASIVKKNIDKSQADKDLWAEATGKPASSAQDTSNVAAVSGGTSAS
ncbi:MAG: DLW-39 family protein [Tetrasphaera sp.]